MMTTLLTWLRNANLSLSDCSLPPVSRPNLLNGSPSRLFPPYPMSYCTISPAGSWAHLGQLQFVVVSPTWLPVAGVCSGAVPGRPQTDLDHIPWRADARMRLAGLPLDGDPRLRAASQVAVWPGRHSSTALPGCTPAAQVSNSRECYIRCPFYGACSGGECAGLAVALNAAHDVLILGPTLGFRSREVLSTIGPRCSLVTVVVII
jgi:hypothetical protein